MASPYQRDDDEVSQSPEDSEPSDQVLSVFESGSMSSPPLGSGLLVPTTSGRRGAHTSRRKSKPKKLVIPEEEDGGSALLDGVNPADKSHISCTASTDISAPLQLRRTCKRKTAENFQKQYLSWISIYDLKKDGDHCSSPAEPEMVPSTGVNPADKSHISCTASTDISAPLKLRRARKTNPAENFQKPNLSWKSQESPSLMFVVPSEETETSAKRKPKEATKAELQEMHWCDICDDYFSTLDDLEEHQLTHIDESEEDFDCEECGRVFDSGPELQEHQSKRHGKLRYSCNICGIQYNYSSQFAIHMRAHSGERLFTCEECGKEFKHRCSLVIHQRRHNGSTPHQCQKCGKMLDTHSALMKHDKMRYCLDCKKCYTHRGFSKHLAKDCIKP